MGVLLVSLCVLPFLGTIHGLLPKLPVNLPANLPGTGISPLINDKPFKAPSDLISSPTTPPALFAAAFEVSGVFETWDDKVYVTVANRDGTPTIEARDNQPTVKNAFCPNTEMKWHSCWMNCNSSFNSVNGIEYPASFSCMAIEKKYNSVEEAKQSQNPCSRVIVEHMVKETTEDNELAKGLIDGIRNIIHPGQSVAMTAIEATQSLIQRMDCRKGFVHVGQDDSKYLMAICMDKEMGPSMRLSKSDIKNMCMTQNNEGLPAYSVKQPKREKLEATEFNQIDMNLNKNIFGKKYNDPLEGLGILPK